MSSGLAVANDRPGSASARGCWGWELFAGDADDIDSIFINPAGLTSLNTPQVTSMAGKFINEVDYVNSPARSPRLTECSGSGTSIPN